MRYPVELRQARLRTLTLYVSMVLQMPTRDDIYRKFGQVSEAAQCLEIELGNLLIQHNCIEASLFERQDPKKAASIFDQINRQTFGQMIRSLLALDCPTSPVRWRFIISGSGGTSRVDSPVAGPTKQDMDDLEQLFSDALAARNRLTHSFFLQHNIRINSEDGCEVMLQDLDAINQVLTEAWDAASLLSGHDLKKLIDTWGDASLPAGHLRMRA